MKEPTRRDGTPADDFTDWRAQQKSFESLAGYSGQSFTLSTENGFPERLRGLRMTPNTLTVLRVTPIQGRDLTDADARPGAAPVALIAHRVWQTQFESDPNVAGRTVRINGARHDDHRRHAAEVWISRKPTTSGFRRK